MPVPQQRDAVHRRLLRDDAYAVLRRAIVDGTLSPGEPLHDAELCSWLGLSRTPLRDALGRLQDDGLVEIEPQRFTRVSPIGERDARDAFPLAAAVHALATELAVPHLRPADLAELRASNEAFVTALTVRRETDAFDADDRFHTVFLRAARNADIDRAVAHLGPRVRRLELLNLGPLPGRRSVAQHEAIIARATAGDAPGAASAVRENWLELGRMIERALARPV